MNPLSPAKKLDLMCEQKVARKGHGKDPQSLIP